jgi:hypothetical protein
MFIMKCMECKSHFINFMFKLSESQSYLNMEVCEFEVQTSVFEGSLGPCGLCLGSNGPWVRPTNKWASRPWASVCFSPLVYAMCLGEVLPHTYLCTYFYSKTRDTSGDKTLPV